MLRQTRRRNGEQRRGEDDEGRQAEGQRQGAGVLMPLSRIEIEQIGPGRWVAEVEAGGTSARRKHVSGENFDDVLLAVVEAHAELTAPPAPPKVMSVRETEVAQSERIAEEVEAQQKGERAVYELRSREELLAEVDRLGIDVDRRWGAARLQEAIDAAKAGAPAD